MTAGYRPPYGISSTALKPVAEISELFGRHPQTTSPLPSPRLRRGNRIRTVQASLQIENKTLSLEQVTAVLDGRPVLGPPRELQEVRIAFAANDGLPRYNPTSVTDLLESLGNFLFSDQVSDQVAFPGAAARPCRPNRHPDDGHPWAQTLCQLSYALSEPHPRGRFLRTVLARAHPKSLPAVSLDRPRAGLDPNRRLRAGNCVIPIYMDLYLGNTVAVHRTTRRSPFSQVFPWNFTVASRKRPDGVRRN